MSAVIGLIDDPFHAPVQYGLVEGMLVDYEKERARIIEVGNLLQNEVGSAISYFLRGNVEADVRGSIDMGKAFNTDGALGQLNADYWARAMAATDVYKLMPQARRDEWNASIQQRTCPDFTLDNVRPTLEMLLDSRTQFLAERVDGIYRGLSGLHVTNNPMAFGQRMIIAGAINSYDSVDSRKSGLIDDLRCVIAKFMGRDDPDHGASYGVLQLAKDRPGQWVTVDGGALRIRVYKVGTAHLEIHEDMAWRLNSILANLHPTAIPASARVAPKSKKRAFQMMDRPLPFKVLKALRGLYATRGEPDLFFINEPDDAVRKEACAVLEMLGGVQERSRFYRFDYPIADVMGELLASGCVPDTKTHQFYPTPESLAARLVDMAEVEDHHRVLEPSAGTGNIAKLLPVEQVTCVEISPLHCSVLRAHGLNTVEGDFLEWAASTRQKFDRVIMNPPFSAGRAVTHLVEAADLLVPGGRIAAILPASCRGKTILDGFEHEYSEVISNEFAGTSVSVVILVATAPATRL